MVAGIFIEKYHLCWCPVPGDDRDCLAKSPPRKQHGALQLLKECNIGSRPTGQRVAPSSCNSKARKEIGKEMKGEH